MSEHKYTKTAYIRSGVALVQFKNKGKHVTIIAMQNLDRRKEIKDYAKWLFENFGLCQEVRTLRKAIRICTLSHADDIELFFADGFPWRCILNG